MDDVNTDVSISDMLIFIIYCISIGFAEELSIRGYLQSHLVTHLDGTRRGTIISVFASSLFFGLIHLLSFDKGIYGEISQVFYATFIGVMFGTLLVITRRLYPLIIIHAIVDFTGDFTEVGIPIQQQLNEAMSLENAILIALLVSPCLFYGVFLMTRNKLTLA